MDRWSREFNRVLASRGKRPLSGVSFARPSSARSRAEGSGGGLHGPTASRPSTATRRSQARPATAGLRQGGGATAAAAARVGPSNGGATARASRPASAGVVRVSVAKKGVLIK